MDWNEDDVQDIVSFGTMPGSYEFELLSAVSGGLAAQNFKGSVLPFTPGGAMRQYVVLDANGDGLDDVVYAASSETGGADQLYLEVRKGQKPDLLTDAVGSFGPHAKVQYAPLQDQSNDTCATPVTCVHGGMWVVSGLDVDNGLVDRSGTAPTLFNHYAYTFSGGRFDRLEGRFIGFRFVTVFDPQSNTHSH
jgi:hypothetical protein